MKHLTEEEKRKNSERFRAIHRGEIKPDYVGVPDEFKNDSVEEEGEGNTHSIGYLYAKGLYLAGYKSKPK
jgi:hypothetical protein